MGSCSRTMKRVKEVKGIRKKQKLFVKKKRRFCLGQEEQNVLIGF